MFKESQNLIKQSTPLEAFFYLALFELFTL